MRYSQYGNEASIAMVVARCRTHPSYERERALHITVAPRAGTAAPQHAGRWSRPARSRPYHAAGADRGTRVPAPGTFVLSAGISACLTYASSGNDDAVALADPDLRNRVDIETVSPASAGPPIHATAR